MCVYNYMHIGLTVVPRRFQFLIANMFVVVGNKTQNMLCNSALFFSQQNVKVYMYSEIFTLQSPDTFSVKIRYTRILKKYVPGGIIVDL
jgi:hypothetical protein